VFVLGGGEIAVQFVRRGLERGLEPEVRFVPGIRALGVVASSQEFSACLSCQLSVGRVADGEER
jgi:hypothetical protein